MTPSWIERPSNFSNLVVNISPFRWFAIYRPTSAKVLALLLWRTTMRQWSPSSHSTATRSEIAFCKWALRPIKPRLHKSATPQQSIRRTMQQKRYHNCRWTKNDEWFIDGKAFWKSLDSKMKERKKSFKTFESTQRKKKKLMQFGFNFLLFCFLV